MRSTLPHAIDISFHPRESLFKNYETIRVPFFQSWRRILPPMLAAFSGKMMLFWDLINTGGNNLFLHFHQLLSLHRRCETPSMEHNENPRRLRFTPNPHIGASLILRDCMKSIFPLYMIINKIGKGSQLSISRIGSRVRENFHAWGQAISCK